MAAVALLHGAPYTVHDLLTMPDDGQRYEVEDGNLLMSPAPSYRHNSVAEVLRDVLRAVAPPGIRLPLAVAVRLRDDRDGRIPDLTMTRVGPRDRPGVLEVPDVLAVVEVVSPGSTVSDRITKPALYAEAGIPCYWRVEIDRFPGQLPGEQLPVVIAHALVGDRYEVAARISAGVPGTVPVPFPVTFDPAVLLD